MANNHVSIDINGKFPLSIVTDPQGRAMVRLDLSNVSKQRVEPGDVLPPSLLIGHLWELAALEVDGNKIRPMQDSKQIAQYQKRLDFPLPEGTLAGQAMLTLRGQPIASFSPLKSVSGIAAITPNDEHIIARLSVSEIRALNMALRRSDDPKHDVFGKLPYNRDDRLNYDPKLHAPITDVHTHLSAQIKSQDLLDVAFLADEKNQTPIAYPVELLELLGFKYRKDDPRLVDMRGQTFTPLRDEGLACENGKECKGVRITQLTEDERAAIVRQMEIPNDTTMDSGDFDRELYRFRNPFIKDPVLTKATIKKIAEDYARMGIEYAELSTGSMTNPEWFRQMTEALDEIARDGVGPEHKKPVLRFLVGLPRNISPQETLVALEKIKYLARHPYIVGIDLLGYESNKTSDFNWALANMADWARAPDGKSDLKPEDGWNFRDDFIIRVHAGETTKNVHNVRDAIKIAHHYGVRVRIGHGLNSKLDDEAKGWLKELRNAVDKKGRPRDLIATERCMDSNQVYRTKKLVHNQPPMLDCDGFLGSDGGGALNTGPQNLSFSAIAAGWTLADLAKLKQFERGYIGRQMDREASKRTAFEKHYGKGTEGFDRFLKGYAENCAKIPEGAPKQMVDYLPEQFTGKRPVLVVGASGSTWSELDSADQKTIRQIAETMVRACDPKKTYFVFGRATKEKEGGKNSVSNIFDEVIRQHNMDHPQNKFAVLGRYAGARQFPTGDLAETISWIQNIEGRDDVPRSMIEFVCKHNGLALILAGSEFTAQMGYSAGYKDVPHALHEPMTKGNPLREVAQIPRTDTIFSNFSQFIDEAFGKTGDRRFFRSEAQQDAFLRDGVNLDELRKIRASVVERSEKTRG